MKLYITKRYSKEVHKVIYPAIVPLTDLMLIKSKVNENRKYNFIWIRY
jgi:hypothetical protein